jgi:hypothetical protein
MIPGLSIVDEWLTHRDETALAHRCDVALAGVPRNRLGSENDGRARIVRYGSPIYNDGLRGVAMPAWLNVLGARLPMTSPDHVTINEWLPGMPHLVHHIDRGGPVICVLSLLASARVDFRELLASARVDFRELLASARVDFREPGYGVIYRVPRRSMMMLAGSARYSYRHSVIDVDERRLSLVFRTAR